MEGRWRAAGSGQQAAGSGQRAAGRAMRPPYSWMPAAYLIDSSRDRGGVKPKRQDHRTIQAHRGSGGVPHKVIQNHPLVALIEQVLPFQIARRHFAGWPVSHIMQPVGVAPS